MFRLLQSGLYFLPPTVTPVIVLAGAARLLLQYCFGKMNGPTSIVIIKALDTQRFICVHPRSETALRRIRGSSVILHAPGGGQKAGETTEQAAIRELKEEAGIILNFFDKRLDTVVCWGKLRNWTTVFYREFEGEADVQQFQGPIPTSKEMTRPYTWNSADEIAQDGTAWLREGLRRISVGSHLSSVAARLEPAE